MILHVETSPSYDVIVERGSLAKAKEYFRLDRKCFLLTDSGIPESYVALLRSQCQESFLLTIPQGEASKSIDNYLKAMSILLENGFSRKDCVIAIGGGVCGDLAGFVASTYMRGIDFYNVPTTLLSMVDSSIGGKTAVDFMGYKNMVGSFYQPKAVLIDSKTLETLDERQFKAGMVEAIKMAATFDEELFSLIGTHRAAIDDVIVRALSIKKKVVELDTKEAGLRKTLNFGHTLGHAYEVLSKGALLHGEAVGLGMIPMSSGEAKKRIVEVLMSYGLPMEASFKKEEILEAIGHDKKGNNGYVDAIFVEKIGSYSIKKTSVEDLVSLSKEAGI